MINVGGSPLLWDLNWTPLAGPYFSHLFRVVYGVSFLRNKIPSTSVRRSKSMVLVGAVLQMP